MVATQMLGKIATWLLILAFLTVFLYGFLGPEDGLLANIVDLGLGIMAFLPASEDPSVQRTATVPGEVLDGRDAIVSSLSDAGPPTGEHCIVPLEGLGSIEGYRVEAVSNANGVLMRLLEPSGPGNIRHSSQQVDGVSLCRVNAPAFYECFFGPDRNCGEDIYSDESTLVFGPDNAADIALQLADERFCLIPVTDDSDRCLLDDGGLSEGCIRQMKNQNQFPTCGEEPGMPIPEPVLTSSLAELDRFLAFVDDHTSEQFPGLCRVPFMFERNVFPEESYMLYNPSGNARLYYSSQDTGQLLGEREGDVPAFLREEAIRDDIFAALESGESSLLLRPYIISLYGRSISHEAELYQAPGISFNLIQKDGVWALAGSGVYVNSLEVCAA